MSKSASTLISILVAFLTLILGGVVTYHFLSKYLLSAAQPGLEGSESFIVEKGWGVKVIGEKLSEKGIINSPISLELLARLNKNKDGERGIEIFPGEYPIHAGLKPREIVDVLKNKKVVYHTVSIPEGFNVSQIAPLMAKTGLTSLSDAQVALNDKSLIAKYRIPAPTLEGYVFPETYNFTRPEGAKEMVDRMLEQGIRSQTADRLNRAKEIGLSFHQVLTLASVIEKETGKASERKTISSVFHNRLRIGMPMQSDPTVIYGVPNFDGNLTKKHLKTPSSYNTYINNGLPPTPIASPGLESIDAALLTAAMSSLKPTKSIEETLTFTSEANALFLTKKKLLPRRKRS